MIFKRKKKIIHKPQETVEDDFLAGNAVKPKLSRFAKTPEVKWGESIDKDPDSIFFPKKALYPGVESDSAKHAHEPVSTLGIGGAVGADYELNKTPPGLNGPAEPESSDWSDAFRSFSDFPGAPPNVKVITLGELFDILEGEYDDGEPHPLGSSGFLYGADNQEPYTEGDLAAPDVYLEELERILNDDPRADPPPHSDLWDDVAWQNDTLKSLMKSKQKYDIDYKFREGETLDEIKRYIDETYSGPYAGKRGVQAFDLIDSANHGLGFCMGNAIKYAARYGKKDGHNKKDIMKAIHYLIMALYVVNDEGIE